MSTWEALHAAVASLTAVSVLNNRTHLRSLCRRGVITVYAMVYGTTARAAERGQGRDSRISAENRLPGHRTATHTHAASAGSWELQLGPLQPQLLSPQELEALASTCAGEKNPQSLFLRIAGWQLTPPWAASGGGACVLTAGGAGL